MSLPSRHIVPKFKHSRKRLSDVLPPARLPVFRTVVAHPPGNYDPKARDNLAPSVGPHTVSFTTNPRAFTPLTFSPRNHLLWNPPSKNSRTNRLVELDSSGRLARFANRFSGMGASLEGMTSENGDGSPFDVDSLRQFEGETVQSTGEAVNAKMLKKPVKTGKKGRK